jgi:protoporphyrinogen oxidase
MEREAWVWMRDQFIPYPFQNNIWRLPQNELLACLDGLIDVERLRHSREKPKNFFEWLEQGFGQGLMDTFMVPYNKKVWAYHPEAMNTEWMGERVATVDLKAVLKNVVLKQDSLGWGPNATFRFPLHGGSGSIWKALYDRLPKEKVRLNSRVVGVDAERRLVQLADGTSLPFDRLISTMPLDVLCTRVTGLSLSQEELAERAKKFVYSNTNIIGFGLEGQPPPHLRTKCWIYFPEDDCPYYRGTVFSNYSKFNVPRPDEQWSLMMEVSESPAKPVDQATVLQEAEQGLRNNKFIDDDTKIASRFHIRLQYGYPTPFFGRDQLCGPIFQALQEKGIYSRGRFGAWKYEVSNQDHSLMQGVEAINNIIFGEEEVTFYSPAVANKGVG